MGKSATAKVIPIEKAKELDDDFLNVLQKTETTKPKTKKSKGSAELTAPAAVKNAIDSFNVAKVDKKKAEGTMKKHEPTILEFVKKEQDKVGFDGKFVKSFDVEGNDSKVKYVSSNRHTVANDDVNLIKDILGDKFNSLVERKWNIKVKDDVLSSRKMQKELMEIMGERFGEFLETSSKLVTSDDFDSKVFEAVESQEDLDDLRTFVKPYKASLR